MVGQYYPNKDGFMDTELPENGPCRDVDGHACEIGRDHYRDRKTGPEFPILVGRCRIHQLRFTIYPIGFAPYYRKRIAPVSPDGSLVVEGKGAEQFAGTYFDAALDAAKSQSWWHSYQEQSESLPAFTTQSMHLKRMCAWFGIAPDSDMKQQEAVIHLLGVPGQLLHDNANLIQAQPGYHNQGIAICAILDAVTIQFSLFERIAELGAISGFWPSLATQNRPPMFQIVRTRAAPN